MFDSGGVVFGASGVEAGRVCVVCVVVLQGVGPPSVVFCMGHIASLQQLQLHMYLILYALLCWALGVLCLMHEWVQPQ